MNKIGFCCIALNKRGKTPAPYQYGTTTVAHMSKLSNRDRSAYIRKKVEQNLVALYNIVGWLKHQPQIVRMYRITSGMLPLYTHSSVAHVYRDTALIEDIQNALRVIGNTARENNIRLSFHPGQFVVLNSKTERVRHASVAEFEYHATLAEWMGYAGKGTDDFCINVHGGVRADVESWDWAKRNLSRRALRLLTLENDEFSWSGRSMLKLCEYLGVRMVYDVHHDWISTGVWSNPDSKLSARIRDTWEDRTPKIHFSIPKPDAIGVVAQDVAQATRKHKGLLTGHTMSKARAHSDYIWSSAMVKYAKEWYDAKWDIQVEAKAKNLASFELARRLR